MSDYHKMNKTERELYLDKKGYIESFYDLYRNPILAHGQSKKKFIAYWINHPKLHQICLEFWVDINLAYNQPRFYIDANGTPQVATEYDVLNGNI